MTAAADSSIIKNTAPNHLKIVRHELQFKKFQLPFPFSSYASYNDDKIIALGN
jgi:hypothetical protein